MAGEMLDHVQQLGNLGGGHHIFGPEARDRCSALLFACGKGA
jgi:hypothetical protein